jgi:hypothetical protein
MRASLSGGSVSAAAQQSFNRNANCKAEPRAVRHCLCPHLSVISEMPPATLCGLGRTFVCRSLLTKKHAFLPRKVAGDEQKMWVMTRP